MSLKLLLSIALATPTLSMHGMQTPTAVSSAEDQWIISQIPKGEIISDPATLQRLKGDIEKVKQYQKSLDYKLQLFGNLESLQKIQKQVATIHTLLTNLLKKSWLPNQHIKAAIKTTSRLEQMLAGYINNPSLINTELADLKVPAVQKRVRTLVDQWSDCFKKLYQFGVLDSESHIPGKESNKLVGVNPWNKELIFDAQGRILVASWVPEYMIKYYTVGKPKDIQGFIPWVTVVPELKTFAQNYLKNKEAEKTGFSLSERISQLLGLPQLLDGVDVPRYVVEMWVEPQNLVRPCIDSEIIDNSCILDTHDSGLPQSFKNTQQYVASGDEKSSWLGSNQPNVTTREWFNNNKAKTYTGASAFPWTRLGYTYDMGSSTNTKIGLSEFLIKPGSTVLIEAITPTNSYPTAVSPRSDFHYQGPTIQD